jgi:hypothetical protein
MNAGVVVGVSRAEASVTEVRAPTFMLGAWRRSWMGYAFDREGGGFSRRLIRLGEVVPTCGFGAIEKTREHGRMFFSLYRWGGRMWFQAGLQCWPLDTDELRMFYRLQPNAPIAQFSVNQGERLVFHCTYALGLRGWFGRIDREGDNVDFEGRHFLAHVAGHELPLMTSDVWHDGEITDDEPTPQTVREAIRDQIGLLADLQRQRDYERQIQAADVPAELLRAWFDDTYHPGSTLFHKAFAPAERAVLRRFTTVLQTASAEIGDAQDVEDLQMHPIWARVVLDAEQALRDVPAVRPGTRH